VVIIASTFFFAFKGQRSPTLPIFTQTFSEFPEPSMRPEISSTFPALNSLVILAVLVLPLLILLGFFLFRSLRKTRITHLMNDSE
jgi:hypothetical protein